MFKCKVEYNWKISVHNCVCVCVWSSICGAPNRHKRADERSGPSWNPTPGLSQLCHEDSVSGHGRPSGAPRAGGEREREGERD